MEPLSPWARTLGKAWRDKVGRAHKFPQEEEEEEAGEAGGGEDEEMPRVKGTCSQCGQTILLLFDDRDPDLDAILALQPGEAFENKCPMCEQWAAFHIPDEPSPEETVTV